LRDMGYHPAEIRLALLGGHYRQQFNFTMNALDAAKSGLGKLEAAVDGLLEKASLQRKDWVAFVNPAIPANWGHFENAWKAFRNDLNTPAVLGALFNGLKRARKDAAEEESARLSLEAAGSLMFALGLELFVRPEPASADVEIPGEIKELAERRWQAKQEKAFSEADRLRTELEAQGWLVVDQPGGYEISPKP